MQIGQILNYMYVPSIMHLKHVKLILFKVSKAIALLVAHETEPWPFIKKGSNTSTLLMLITLLFRCRRNFDVPAHFIAKGYKN